MFGHDAAITLMELLPPIGWADVASKHDLPPVERRLDGASNDWRAQCAWTSAPRDPAQTWKLMTLMVAVVGVVVATVRL